MFNDGEKTSFRAGICAPEPPRHAPCGQVKDAVCTPAAAAKP